MLALRLGVELGAGGAVGARAGARGPAAAGGGTRGVLAAHGTQAFTATASADPRFSLPFLLSRLAAGFLALALGKAPAILLGTFVFRGARLMKSDGDCLAAALHFAAFAAPSSFQFAMFEFMHDAAFGLSLPR